MTNVTSERLAVNVTDKNNILIFDGGMGTMLQKGILKDGELPELLNMTNPDALLDIHKMYVSAGAEVITSNTFGANRRKLAGKADVSDVVTAAVGIAKQSGAKYVALDIGPTGAMLEPYGTLSFDEAYDMFEEQISAGVAAGCDCIIIETMSDLAEAKAAVLAAKENCRLPVFVTMSFEEDGRTFLGTTPEIAAVTLSSLGVDAVGINCSLGPKEVLPLVERMLAYSRVPVMVQPNAGLPQIKNGKTVFIVEPDEFAGYIKQMTDIGVRIVGGCCGTTPTHIRAVADIIKGTDVPEVLPRYVTAFTSSQNLVVLGDNDTCVIGERINPTGKKKLKQAIINEDMAYIASEAINQTEAGADILDVNAGLPDIDEKHMLVKMIKELQSVTPLPLQIDSSDAFAVEAAARIYSGKPIINSVNGKPESMDRILPIAKKYGAAVVALTLDENGIPDTAEGRVAVAEKIIEKAASYGIPKEDILVDCLVLTASTNQAMVMETLRAVSIVKARFGVKTILGVSNVSFGLPKRELINSTFLAAAFGCGLNVPILNPNSRAYMDVVNSFKVLNNENMSIDNFIQKYSDSEDAKPAVTTSDISLDDIIVKGYKTMAADATQKLLDDGTQPLDIINNIFIPALNIVGEKFEKGEMFLPQLMASAETVKAGFDVIEKHSGNTAVATKGKIILATVKGDIHDIGKNIVAMILSNYGYQVPDLGKDVEPQVIVDRIKADNVTLVGLSALMTTTVKSMADTIALIRSSGCECKIMVGGAVLNEEYTRMVGADYYAKDAAGAARIAETHFNS